MTRVGAYYNPRLFVKARGRALQLTLPAPPSSTAPPIHLNKHS
jgi:hypothetical protein